MTVNLLPLQTSNILLPQNIYIQHLEVIKGIRFTRREIDVMACMLSGRGRQATASLLLIADKTVEAHTRNIMLKSECNSRERIRAFIEKSGKFSIIKQYYSSLLIQAAFQKSLQEIATLLERDKVVCWIVYDQNANKASLIYQLEKDLKFAGIETKIEPSARFQSTIQLTDAVNLHRVNCLLYNISTTLISQLQASKDKAKLQIKKLTELSIKKPGSVLFFLDEKHNIDELPEGICPVEYIDFKKQENYYSSVFEILIKALPYQALEKIILEFKNQYDLIYHSSDKIPISISSGSDNLLQANKPKSTSLYLFPKYKRFKFAISSLLCISVGAILILIFSDNKVLKPQQEKITQQYLSIRSALPLPVDTALLQRPQLMAQIKNKLGGQNTIQTVALVGPGGAGKTTLARQYAHSQKTSIIWEINAETNETLISSFEEFAYALLKTEKDKQILRELKNIKDRQERHEKTLLFVKEKLKTNPNWFLIYDNAEEFYKVKRYFPSDPDVWGAGKIILTTRDSNIQNNTHINNIILINELTSQERLKLFIKIMNHGNTHQLSSAQEAQSINFLNSVPPFPLDVSIAAYYLKDTSISYNKYKEYLNNYNKSFTSLQERILKDIGGYRISRYNIISLALKRLIDTNKDFERLLLFISFLDSQNIPRDLLEACENDLVVDNFIYKMKKSSLITNQLSNGLTSTFAIHRSTQEISLIYLAEKLNLTNNKPLLQNIINIFEDFIVSSIAKGDPEKIKLLISHCERFLRHNSSFIQPFHETIKGELGYLYYLQGNYIKAKNILVDISNKPKSINKENAPRIARQLMYLGQVYWDLGDFQQARNRIEHSLEIYKKHLPTHKIGFAKALALQGIVYSELNDYKKAKKLLSLSLEFYQKFLPENYLGIAEVQVYLGVVSWNLGDFNAAKIFLEKAVIIYKKYLPQEYATFAWALIQLANVNRDLGNYKKSEALYQESLKIYEKQIPSQQVEIARILARLGNINRYLGRYQKAIIFFEKSLKIYKNHLPSNHVAFPWALANLANVYRELYDYKKAMAVIEQGLKIYKKNFPKINIEVARALTYKANILKGLGEYEKAKSLFQDCLVIYEKNYGKDHIECIRILTDLGEVHFLIGDIEKAEKYLSTALYIFKKQAHPEAYLALEKLGNLLLKKSIQEIEKANIEQAQKYKKQAIDCIAQALKIVKTHFPRDSSHVKRIQSKLESLI